MSRFLLLLLFTGLISCEENVYPRPKGQLRLEYPEATYIKYQGDEIPLSFERSQLTKVDVKDKFWINLLYPKMKATLHLTYTPVENNTEVLLNEINKLTYKHSVKASGIIERPYINKEKNIYGMLFEVTGNSASNLQFYVTDSLNHIFSGALYFYAVPNSDSLSPAVNYIKKDVEVMMETLVWDNNDTLKLN